MRVGLLLACAAWSFSSSCCLAEDVNIEVLTEIRPVSVLTFQAGIKSHQIIRLDLSNASASQTVETGVTNVAGFDWPSIRDDFRIVRAVQEGAMVVLSVQGQTASVVTVLPDIDYAFTLRFDPGARTVALSGCHDAYPSYTVRVGGRSIYDREQTGTAVVGLLGTCDVVVDQSAVPY